MGKTKDRIWKYYTTKSNNVYSCNYCNKTYFKNATRMKTHLIKCCKKCPKNIVDTFKDKGKFSGDSSTDNEYLSVSNTDLSLHAFMDTNSNAPSTSTCSTSAPLTPNRGSSQASTSRSSFDIQCSTPNIPRSNNLNLKKNLFSPSITGFMDSITSSEQEKLENQLARAIYSSYCPLSLVENPEWTKLFKMMRPSFTMPSRYKLSGPVLDQEFEKVKSEVETVIHHEAVTLGLQSDGWSNIRNEGIINVIITVPSPLLVSTIPTKISRHTGEYIADEMGKVIEKYGVEKFLGFVSDNAKNMQKAGKLLFEKYGIIYYGCAVHTLNLLTTDLIKLNSIRKLVVIIKKITVSIRQSQVLLALLRKKQEENKEVEPNASELQLPVKTRWSSIINCLRSVFNSKLSLQGLSVSVEGAGYLDKTVN